MMNYDIEYDITVYDKYTSKIKELLKEDKFKIYIISDSKQQKNKELIYYIREDLDDWQSIIIIMKKETDDYQRLANKSLFLLDIIPKEKDFREQLKRAIQIALKNYDQRPNTLKYCYKKVYYNIEFWKIIYIEKQPEMKICKIKTIDKDYYIQGSLNQKQELLDKRFLKCNRSYIINLEQIESYNPKTNRITFKNKETLDATSRTKKKEMIQYFRRIEK